MTINKAIITGNLTRDAELRSTGGGLAVANFAVAVNERVKNNSTGEWEDRANYIDCTMFGRRAEALAQYMTKGTKVTIEGKLRWSQWEKNGEKRSKVEVVVDEVELMARGEKRAPEAPSASQGVYDEDIPF
jgi:single-strand DNA-binding protein